MVKRIRVLMANQPKLMRELLLEMLKEESWIEIVGEATQESEIREFVQQTAPDLVVVTADMPGRRPAICDELLSEFLALRVIAVTPNENYAVSYWASLEFRSIATRLVQKYGYLRPSLNPEPDLAKEPFSGIAIGSKWCAVREATSNLERAFEILNDRVWEMACGALLSA